MAHAATAGKGDLNNLDLLALFEPAVNCFSIRRSPVHSDGGSAPIMKTFRRLGRTRATVGVHTFVHIGGTSEASSRRLKRQTLGGEERK